MKILICSTDGDEGGMYDYELDAIRKHAPALSKAQLLPTKDLHWSTAYDSEVVLVFDRTTREYDHLFLKLDLLNRLAVFSQKLGRKVYLLTRTGYLVNNQGAYRLYNVGVGGICERCFIQEAWYTFHRCGGKKIKTKEEYFLHFNEAFPSVDWQEVAQVILPSKTRDKSK